MFNDIPGLYIKYFFFKLNNNSAPKLLGSWAFPDGNWLLQQCVSCTAATSLNALHSLLTFMKKRSQIFLFSQFFSRAKLCICNLFHLMGFLASYVFTYASHEHLAKYNHYKAWLMKNRQMQRVRTKPILRILVLWKQVNIAGK